MDERHGGKFFESLLSTNRRPGLLPALSPCRRQIVI